MNEKEIEECRKAFEEWLNGLDALSVLLGTQVQLTEDFAELLYSNIEDLYEYE